MERHHLFPARIHAAAKLTRPGSALDQGGVHPPFFYF